MAIHSTFHISAHFYQGSQHSFQLKRDGCQLVSSTLNRFTSGEKRKEKTSIVKIMERAVCCYIPFFNNLECISGYWHFSKMSEYLLYQTPGYLRLPWLLLGCSQSLWNCLRLQQLQRRPLRKTENSHTE